MIPQTPTSVVQNMVSIATPRQQTQLVQPTPQVQSIAPLFAPTISVEQFLLQMIMQYALNYKEAQCRLDCNRPHKNRLVFPDFRSSEKGEFPCSAANYRKEHRLIPAN